MVSGPMAPVVVGLDGSAPSVAAAYLAADEAVARVAPLVLVHAYRPAVDEPPGAFGWARQMLAAAADRACTEHPGLAVSAVFVRADPVETLLRHAERAGLVVLGHGGTDVLPVRRLGSVAVCVAGQARVPVIVCRPFDAARPGGEPRPVVVGVEGPDEADPLLGFAFEEAALRGAPVEVWHVRREGAGPQWTEPERALADAVTCWSGKYPQIAVRGAVWPGPDVVDALVGAAHHGQLLVIGRHRPADPRLPALGPISRALVERAGCPVAVAG